MTPAESKTELDDFWRESHQEGVAAMLYLHVNEKGEVRMYADGTAKVLMQMALAALEWSTEQANEGQA